MNVLCKYFVMFACCIREIPYNGAYSSHSPFGALKKKKETPWFSYYRNYPTILDDFLLFGRSVFTRQATLLLESAGCSLYCMTLCHSFPQCLLGPRTIHMDRFMKWRRPQSHWRCVAIVGMQYTNSGGETHLSDNDMFHFMLFDILGC